MNRALALLGLWLVLASGTQAAALTVGSKNFTESLILAEILRAQALQEGLVIEHRAALGGSAILWRALHTGAIDAYPEYLGTLTQELVPEAMHDDLPALRERLQAQGIGISESLGFDDGYALAMREDEARRLGIARLSQLALRPSLRYALSNEFLRRTDGWPGLAAAYGLRPASAPQGLDHDLAYRALAAGRVDVIDVYTTDAQILQHRLRVLADDRGYFPSYEAVLLYRLDALRREPAFARSLRALEGRINRGAMQRLNAAVQIQGRSESAVASEFVGGVAAP